MERALGLSHAKRPVRRQPGTQMSHSCLEFANVRWIAHPLSDPEVKQDSENAFGPQPSLRVTRRDCCYEWRNGSRRVMPIWRTGMHPW